MEKPFLKSSFQRLLPLNLLINFALTGDTIEKYAFEIFIDGDTEKIVLRSSQVEKVIQYYFSKYKGESCYKLRSQIRDRFAGVSKHVIQEWINSNRRHCES